MSKRRAMESKPHKTGQVWKPVPWPHFSGHWGWPLMVLGPLDLVLWRGADQPLQVETPKEEEKAKTVSDSVSCCYALLYWYNRPEFVDTCCCSFDGNMGNMVNQLLCYLCCLGRTKTRGQGKVSLGIGRHGSRVWRGVGQCWARHTSIECEAFRSIRKHKMKSYYVIFMICTTTEYYSVIFGNVL